MGLKDEFLNRAPWMAVLHKHNPTGDILGVWWNCFLKLPHIKNSQKYACCCAQMNIIVNTFFLFQQINAVGNNMDKCYFKKIAVPRFFSIHKIPSWTKYGYLHIFMTVASVVP